MSIEKVPGGYRVRWRDGNRNRAHLTGPRKQDAIDYEAEIVRSKRMGTLAHMDMGKEILDDFARGQFFPNHLAQREHKTQLNYANTYDKHILPYLGHKQLGAIARKDVAGWLATLERKNVGRRAQQMALQVLNVILNKAVEWEALARNPAAKMARPKHQPKEVVPPTPVQVERLRASLQEEGRMGDAVLVSVLAYGGLRPLSEALALTWSDVRDRTIYVRDPKRTKPRSVTMWPTLFRDLAEWRLAQGGQYELVFPNKRGEQWTETGWGNWRNRVWDQDYPPKDLRHTHSSLMIREDALSVAEQAKQAGHSIRVHLDIYSHIFDELQGKGSAEEAIREARATVAQEREAA